MKKMPDEMLDQPNKMILNSALVESFVLITIQLLGQNIINLVEDALQGIAQSRTTPIEKL